MPYNCTCWSCRGDGRDDVYDDVYDDDSGLINSYSFKPEPVFYGAGPLFLGAEIEVATPYAERGSVARAAAEAFGSLAYLKEDSSISDGFEIVTHPMSYRYAIDQFPWDGLTALQEVGAQADDSTGIHVHLSRDGFTSPSHMYRWMKLIYRNRREVVRVAGRESDQWAPFHREARRNVKAYVDKRNTDRFYANRYNAINVANRETLELRIFASSLAPTRVQAALGFAAATAEYAGQLTAHDVAHNNGWSWPSFADWVAPKLEYEPLVKRMVDLGIGSVGKAAQTCAF